MLDQMILVVASVMIMSFKVIKNELTDEERFMHRIRSLYSDLDAMDGNLAYLEQTLIAIDNYLCELEHNFQLEQATFRLKEAIFWVQDYNRS